jgi:RNA polymerase primary sigma factor
MLAHGELPVQTLQVEGPAFSFEGPDALAVVPEPTALDLQAIALREQEEDLPSATIIGKDVEVSADPVSDYLRQIGKTPLLNAEQEVAISKRIEAGLYAEEKLRAHEEGEQRITDGLLLGDLQWIAQDGGRAKNNMLEANLRLVVSIAKRYTGRGMGFLDVIQEGNLGLVRAVDKFDYQKGYKFSTYATWWVRQAITRALANQAHNIRKPVHRVELINKMNRLVRDLTADMGAEPTVEEIAAGMDLEVSFVVQLIHDAQDTVSMDKKVGDDGESRFGDFVPDPRPGPEEIVVGSAARTATGSMLDHLDETTARIIRLRTGMEDGTKWTQDKVGEEVGLSRNTVQKLEKAGMARLRALAVARGLGPVAVAA